MFISLGAAVLLIAGALKVNMATGNETLVQSDSEAFISNYEMEETFGGDGIMVLLKGKEEDLLSQEIMEKMWNVEQRLQYNENIYSFLSPASIVHQVTKKQSETITEKIPEISDGLLTMLDNLKEISDELRSKNLPDLDEMGNQLISVGKELETQELPNPEELSKKFDSLIQNLDPDQLMNEMMGEQQEELDQMKQQVGQMSAGLKEMSENLTKIGSEMKQMGDNSSGDILEEFEQLEKLPAAFDQLITAQNNLNQGITQLDGGLGETASNLESLASSLQAEVENIDDPELKKQFQQTAQIINESANGLSNMADNTGELKEVPISTATALIKMKKQLTEMVEKIEGDGSNQISSGQLDEMTNGLITMGENLNEISKNMNQIPEKFDEMLDGEGSTDALNNMMTNMEKEISMMKKSLSDGINPNDLKNVSVGFVMMGENLKTISNKMIIYLQN